MSFLSYNKGKVAAQEESFVIPELAALHQADNTKDKRYFQECITYLFWMYKKNNIYSQRPPKQAMELIKKTHLSKYDPSEMEKDKLFKGLKEYYIDDQYSVSERFWLSIKNDMQSLLDHIAAIPFSKTAKVDQNVEIEGPNGPVMVRVKTELLIDNSDEKARAIALSERLINLEEKLAQKIKKEDQEKRIADSKAIFDTA